MEVQNLSSVHPVAIVTGASSGIGLEYARELCSRGYDVVMVSNEEERLTQRAGEFSQTYEVQTWPLYHYRMQRSICMVFAWHWDYRWRCW